MLLGIHLMKNYLRPMLFCFVGLVAGLSIYGICQNSGDNNPKPMAPRSALMLANPTIKELEWRQPLLHPTYPPKLVQGEKEFVLK